MQFFVQLLNNSLDSMLNFSRSLYIKLDRILTKIKHGLRQKLYKRVIIPLYYRESTYIDTLETAQTYGCVRTDENFNIHCDSNLFL